MAASLVIWAHDTECIIPNRIAAEPVKGKRTYRHLYEMAATRLNMLQRMCKSTNWYVSVEIPTHQGRYIETIIERSEVALLDITKLTWHETRFDRIAC